MVWKNFGQEKVLVRKKFWSGKNVGQEKILIEKIWVPKKFVFPRVLDPVGPKPNIFVTEKLVLIAWLC